MGNQLYNNGLFPWTMPDEFDPAHPPFLGFILALFWKTLGHSLWVSHLAMVPFVVGFVYQIQVFILHFTKNYKLALLGTLFVLIDPSISSSLVLSCEVN